MKIYTKSGDLGETGLLTGKRISKAELVIEANGALDESTSYVGWAREQITDDQERDLLSEIQHSLYEIMGYLAGAPLDPHVYIQKVAQLEQQIDSITAGLPVLTRFILPQGSEATMRLHIARTAIRSAERRVVGYIRERTPQKNENEKDAAVIQYLNRLSDFFFTLSRKYAQTEKLAL